MIVTRWIKSYFILLVVLHLSGCASIADWWLNDVTNESPYKANAEAVALLLLEGAHVLEGNPDNIDILYHAGSGVINRSVTQSRFSHDNIRAIMGNNALRVLRKTLPKLNS